VDAIAEADPELEIWGMEKHLTSLIGHQVIARFEQPVAPSPYDYQLDGILEIVDTCNQVIQIGDTLINMRHAVLLSVMEMGNPRAVGAAAIMEMKAYLKELMSPLVDADAMPTIAERLLDMLHRAEEAGDNKQPQPENETGSDGTQDHFYLAGFYLAIYTKEPKFFKTLASEAQYERLRAGINAGFFATATYWQTQRHNHFWDIDAISGNELILYPFRPADVAVATATPPTFHVTLDDAATSDTGVEAIHLTQHTTMPAAVTYIAVPSYTEVQVGDRVWAKNGKGDNVKGMGVVQTKHPLTCTVLFGDIYSTYAHKDYGTKWGATRQQQPAPAQEEAQQSEPAEDNRPWDNLKVGDPVWVKGWSRLGSIDSIDGTCFQVVDSSGYRLPLYPDTFGRYWGIPDPSKTTEGETK
jgi:hypothetical protein